MKIKSYNEWISEQVNNQTNESAYNAGIQAAKEFYNEDHVNTLNYADQKIRRTSGLNLEIVDKLIEVADLIPEIMDHPQMARVAPKLLELKKAVEDKHAEPDPFPRLTDV